MISPPYLAILDDDAAVGKALKRLLKPLQIHVRVFTWHTELLEAVAQREPECLLLDMQMPEISGLEVQEQLLSLGRHFPIIFITAHQDEAARQRALDRGAKGFVIKPFNSRGLLELIAAARGLSAAAPARGLKLKVRGDAPPVLAQARPEVVDFELTDLLPCPFCLGFPRVDRDCIQDPDGLARYWARILCPRCGATMPSTGGANFPTTSAAYRDVSERWNRRAATPQLPGR